MKTSPSGLEIKAVYHQDDAAGAALGEPGQFPYTRGVQPDMYRGRLWTMRQYAGFGTAAESNTRYKMLLAAGQTGLSVAFDLPTQMGIDSDAPSALGEVGRVGVAIDTVEDMHTLFDGIPLDKVSTSMTINATASTLLAMYIVVAEERGIDRAALSGTTQNDILKEYIARGTYVYPPVPSLALVAETFRFCAAEVPNWNPISISGYHIREAGATAVQELAFTFANTVEYVQRALAAGLRVDDFAPRLSFFFACHNDLFEEVAKFRAARRLYARLMRDRFGASDASARLRFHTQTGGVTLTAQQPLNNVVRVAYQAMAAVLGGCQSLHTDSMDETLGLPTEQAVTVALRTQQILAHETGVTRVTDPLGGSWFVEALTDKMEEEALNYIAEIDDMGRGPWATGPGNTNTGGNSGGYGGVVEGIHRGYFRRKIAEASYRFSEECEAKDRIIVGVNEYIDNEEGRPIEILMIPDSVETEQVERLTAFKSRRNAAHVSQALDNIRAACQGKPYTLVHDLPGIPKDAFASPSQEKSGPLHETNVMPALIDGALSNCTLGEMVQAMADIYGRYAGGPEW